VSPFLFSVFIDDLVNLVNKDNIGCRIGASCTAIFLYADDIILLAPSVQGLQLLINICISELNYLDMAINVKKSACMRFGPRYKNVCANVVVYGKLINWVTSSSYLDVYLESCSKFICSFSSKKSKFYKVFNSLFGKKCA